MDTNVVPEYIVRATTVDGRTLEFNAFTGEIIKKPQPPKEPFLLYANTLTKSQKEFAEKYRAAHDTNDLVALAHLVYMGTSPEDERLRWLSKVMPWFNKPLCNLSFRGSSFVGVPRQATLPIKEWLYVGYAPDTWAPGDHINTNWITYLVLPIGITNGQYYFSLGLD